MDLGRPTYITEAQAFIRIYRLSRILAPLTEASVGYPNHVSVYFYARFHKENLKQDSFNSFPPKVYRYLYTLPISNFKLEIVTVTQIVL